LDIQTYLLLILRYSIRNPANNIRQHLESGKFDSSTSLIIIIFMLINYLISYYFNYSSKKNSQSFNFKLVSYLTPLVTEFTEFWELTNTQFINMATSWFEETCQDTLINHHCLVVNVNLKIYTYIKQSVQYSKYTHMHSIVYPIDQLAIVRLVIRHFYVDQEYHLTHFNINAAQ